VHLGPPPPRARPPGPPAPAPPPSHDPRPPFGDAGVCYVALKSNVDVKGKLVDYGLMPKPVPGEEHQPNWLERLVAGKGGTLALAFICNKFLFPIRTPITLTLTPLVARHLQRIRAGQ